MILFQVMGHRCIAGTLYHPDLSLRELLVVITSYYDYGCQRGASECHNAIYFKRTYSYIWTNSFVFSAHASEGPVTHEHIPQIS